MNKLLIIICSVAYLSLLFLIAYLVEQQRKSKSKFLDKSWIYALSLAVYCTAWTFYGSVGRAVTNGPEFLTIYLGPSVMCALFIPVLRKLIIICKTQRINTIADLISNRYGKNYTLGILVTLFCIVGVLPYIAIQLKAIATSLHIITGVPKGISPASWSNDTLVIAGILSVFIIIFGTRSADASERHEGLVATIAFESIIKLIAFLALGFTTCYVLFNGFAAISSEAQLKGFTRFFTLHDGLENNDWLAMIFVSGLATIFLPRQFQVAVVENTDVRHLHKATWLFPLYLLLINIFVLPVAMGGQLLLGNQVSVDAYVLALPLRTGHPLLGLLVYIGGFSAASGMIIVETIALSTMVSNNLILPLGILKNLAAGGDEKATIRSIIFSRRASIVIILLLACLYDKWIATSSSLVSIGLISMAAVAQFAPAVIGGLYLKWLTRKGAITAITLGFFVWFITIVVPSIITAGYMDHSILDQGFFGISWLRPTGLFGVQRMGVLAHGVFWSMIANIGSLFVISLLTHPSRQEEYQSELFVHIDQYIGVTGGPGMWKLSARMESVSGLLANFIGRERAANLLGAYAQRHKILLDKEEADPRIIDFSEKILTGVIGSASARVLISNIAQEEEISISEVMNIVKESQQVLELNKELKKKSAELSRAKQQLTDVNERLMKSDVLKDEFLYTVTHELRTPLTSIRALSEILYDNPDMEEEQRQFYLEAIVKEIERLSHLITQVLNLERYESGRQKLNYAAVELGGLIAEVIASLQPLAQEKRISLAFTDPNFMTLQQCDRDLIRQVIYNLVSNAIKFVPEDTGCITVTCRMVEDELQVWVEDNGKGIPAELRELVFDKFFQAKNQTIQKPVGSGLGLAICKRIVEMHGGRIFVDGLSPQGAKFVFTFPSN
ncbi:sensor histidine kinase [Rurimicrobium arvi]|uniref:histidine kinase n=1 Tax=Rurimicrobium arvi TaxID=2049916 RepID=A0ABP8MYK7_9BACT